MRRFVPVDAGDDWKTMSQVKGDYNPCQLHPSLDVSRDKTFCTTPLIGRKNRTPPRRRGLTGIVGGRRLIGIMNESSHFSSTSGAENDPGLQVDPAVGLDETGFSFLRLDPKLDRLVLEMPKPAGGIERYSANWICCNNPVCDCRTLRLQLAPFTGDKSDGTPFIVALLFDEQRIENETGTPAFAKQLSRRFTRQDWVAAQVLYEEMKAEVSEPDDATDLDVQFPADVLRDPAILMSYQEVIPYARDMYFESHGQDWCVRERYSTNPDCPCAEVALCFAARPSHDTGWPRVITEKIATTAWLNLKTAAVRPIKEIHQIPSATLVAELRASHSDLLERLERRQRVLHGLHKKARNAPLARRSAPLPPPRASLVPKERKPDRYDPCPCGSGKKFKFCCERL